MSLRFPRGIRIPATPRVRAGLKGAMRSAGCLRVRRACWMVGTLAARVLRQCLVCHQISHQKYNFNLWLSNTASVLVQPRVRAEGEN